MFESVQRQNSGHQAVSSPSHGKGFEMAFTLPTFLCCDPFKQGKNGNSQPFIRGDTFLLALESQVLPSLSVIFITPMMRKCHIFYKTKGELNDLKIKGNFLFFFPSLMANHLATLHIQLWPVMTEPTDFKGH